MDQDVHVAPELLKRAAEMLKSGKVSLASLAGLDQSEIDATHQHARNLLKQGLNEEARDILNALLVMSPRDGRLYQSLGVALLRCKQYGLASMTFTGALAFMPDDVACLALKAESDLHVFGRKRAIPPLEAVIKKGTTSSDDEVYVRRAQALLNRLAQARDEADAVH